MLIINLTPKTRKGKATMNEEKLTKEFDTLYNDIYESCKRLEYLQSKMQTAMMEIYTARKIRSISEKAVRQEEINAAERNMQLAKIECQTLFDELITECVSIFILKALV